MAQYRDVDFAGREVHYNEVYGGHKYDSMSTPRMQRIVKASEFTLGKMLLDVGCGEGAAANWFAEKGYTTWGLDISSEAILTAKQGLAYYGPKLPPHEFTDTGIFIQCDIETRLPFPDAFFDNVVAIEVMEHVIGPAVLAQEMLRVLKQPGRIFVTVPKAEFSFNCADHCWAYEPEDFKLLFAPHKVTVNTTDWHDTMWVLVE